MENGFVKPNWLSQEAYDGLSDYWKERLIDDKTAESLDPKVRNLVEEYLMEGITKFSLYNIIGNMKEVPFQQSELPVPGDTYPLTKVEFPGEGGVLSYQGGFEQPYRGFPFFEVVEKIDLIKKISRASLSGLYHSFKAKKWFLFTLLPAVWMFKYLLNAVVYAFYRLLERTRIKPRYYSQTIRELYRAFSVPRPKENARVLELRLMLRDLICMVLEFDNAYRFRFQDWVEELNKKNLKKNLIKEFSRILNIAQSREQTQEIRDTWTLLKMFNSFYLRFDPELKRMMRDVLGELNIEKVKLTLEDEFFCKKRKDYIFGFVDKQDVIDKSLPTTRS